MKAEEWSKHLEDLRAISVLANQATEYVYNKNKTEGKTGVIKPDLIPQEKRASAEAKKSKESPKKTTESPKKTTTESPKKSILVDVKKPENLEHLTKELATKSSPEKSKLTKETEKLIKTEQITSQSAAKVAGNKDGAITTATTSNAKAAENAISTSPKSHGSPSKTRAKPTEIKKPAIIDTGRFKASKLIEAITTPTTPPAETATSELEKLAAAKLAEKSKSKSPISPKVVDDKTVAKAKEENITASTSKEPEKPNEKFEPQVKQPEVKITPEKTETKTAATAAATAAGASSSSAPSAVKDNAKRPSLKRHKDSLAECKPLNVLVYAETVTAKESAVNTLKEILADNT